MRRSFQIIKVIISGLMISQVLFVLYLYLSISEFVIKLTEVKNSGFLIVPGEIILNDAINISTLFYGALFFTISIGALVTVFSLTGFLLLSKAKKRRVPVLMIIFAFWAGFLFKINQQSFQYLLTLILLLISLTVIVWSKRLISVEKKSRGQWKNLIHLVPLLILGLLFYQNHNKYFLLDARDTLLLSNPVGNVINHFYYKYSLYPAETIKNLDQKTVKSVYFSGIKEGRNKNQLSAELIKNDYFPINSAFIADLIISEIDDDLLFSRSDKVVLKVRRHRIPENLQDWLRQFSQLTDNFSFLRRSIHVSLLVVLPVLLYFIAYWIISALFGFMLSACKSRIVTSVVCLCLGLFLFFTVNKYHWVEIDASNVQAAVVSSQINQRIAALQYLSFQKKGFLNPWQFNINLQSESIVERYWLANALNVIESKKIDTIIQQLLNDPHPNVACRALYAAGKTKNRQFIKHILKIAKTSNNWYVQNHAYQALKELGWMQI